MRKILLVTSSFETSHGGIASYSQDLVYALKDQYIITVITGDDYVNTTTDLCEILHFNLRDLSKKNASFFLNKIKDLNVDIIINSNAVLLTCVTPFINQETILISISHFVNGTIAKLAGLNFQYLNKLIVLSEYGKSYIKRKYSVVDSKKIHVIYNYMAKKKLEN